MNDSEDAGILFCISWLMIVHDDDAWQQPRHDNIDLISRQ
jgi:hypothetical protein